MLGHGIKHVNAINYEQALLKPSRHFESPAAVVVAPELTVYQKSEILKRWEAAARNPRAAPGEALSGEEQRRLEEVEEALANLHRGAEEPA
jgi:hypothetical protein